MLILVFFIFSIIYFWLEFSYFIPKEIEKYEKRKFFVDRYQRRIRKKYSKINAIVFAVISVLLFLFEDLTSYGIMPSLALCYINLIVLFWVKKDEEMLISLLKAQRANRRRK